MTLDVVRQLALLLAILLLTAWPLGRHIARVLDDGEAEPPRWRTRVEAWVLRAMGLTTPAEMSARAYAKAFVAFTGASIGVVLALQLAQSWLPLSGGHADVPPLLALETAVSFATNTNWQSYSGETTLGPLVQMLGLTVQNFVSAAAGLAVLVALVRGLVRRNATTIGNFWLDVGRATIFVLLPLSTIVALLLVSQGVVQTLDDRVVVERIEPSVDENGEPVIEQTIALGPAASQVAIKQLGTNGGGVYNANSAHPLENPTPASNELELLAILLIPAALCFSYGRWVRDRRQGIALFAVMVVLFVPMVIGTGIAESQGNSVIERLGVGPAPGLLGDGGSLEGKEVRFGVPASVLWATATTAASNGSVNAMHDSLAPLGGLFPLWLMQLGEVVFGGVGSGLCGLLLFAFVAVFVGGLMVGRTPEYLGKKIEAFEIQMTSIAILLPASVVLIGTAVGVAWPLVRATMGNPGPHGLTEVLYAFSSLANNNGSAFGGLSADAPFWHVAGSLAMLAGRLGVALPVIAIAGSLGRKGLVAAGPGTLPTHTPLFATLLIGVVLLVGALTFIPALALGPIVEHLALAAR